MNTNTNMIIVAILVLRFLVKLRFPASTPISSYLKSTNSVNPFKHMIKDNFFHQYTERRNGQICVLLKQNILSYIHDFALPKSSIYPKAPKIIMFIIFATTSKETIMKVRLTRSFNAIPATLIRDVFNLYLSNMLCKLYYKYFIYLFILLFDHCKCSQFVANFYLLTYLPTKHDQMNL